MSGWRPGDAAGHSTAPGLEVAESEVRIAPASAARKRDRVLSALLRGPLSTFQAERGPVWDHCLPSSISELRKAGLEISTKIITVAGYHGLPARIAEYHLVPTSRALAARMVGEP